MSYRTLPIFAFSFSGERSTAMKTFAQANLALIALVAVAGCQHKSDRAIKLPPPTTTATTQAADGTARGVTVYAEQPVTETKTTPLSVEPPAFTEVAVGPLPLLFRTAGPTHIRVVDDLNTTIAEADVQGDLFVRVETRGVFVGSKALRKVALRGRSYSIFVVPPAGNESTQTRTRPNSPPPTQRLNQ